ATITHRLLMRLKPVRYYTKPVAVPPLGGAPPQSVLKKGSDPFPEAWNNLQESGKHLKLPRGSDPFFNTLSLLGPIGDKITRAHDGFPQSIGVGTMAQTQRQTSSADGISWNL